MSGAGSLARTVNDFEGRDGMDLPGGSAPVARAAGGGVHGFGTVFGVEEEPAADAHPTTVKMVADSVG
jgi:hypothetical protein